MAICSHNGIVLSCGSRLFVHSFLTAWNRDYQFAFEPGKLDSAPAYHKEADQLPRDAVDYRRLYVWNTLRKDLPKDYADTYYPTDFNDMGDPRNGKFFAQIGELSRAGPKTVSVPLVKGGHRLRGRGEKLPRGTPLQELIPILFSDYRTRPPANMILERFSLDKRISPPPILRNTGLFVPSMLTSK